MSRFAATRSDAQKKTKRPKEHDEASRLAWLIQVRALNSYQLVFGDESARFLNMRRSYARSPKGQPAYSSEAYRPEGKVNLLTCMSLEGVVAPWLVEGGTVNTQVFSYYLERILAPQLRPGQILVLDNFPIHRAAVVAECLQKHVCKLMLPPTYLPDLNPSVGPLEPGGCRYYIELLFAKLKADLRRISAATVEALSQAIHQTLKHVELHHLICWFRPAGYLVY